MSQGLVILCTKGGLPDPFEDTLIKKHHPGERNEPHNGHPCVTLLNSRVNHHF